MLAVLSVSSKEHPAAQYQSVELIDGHAYPVISAAVVEGHR